MNTCFDRDFTERTVRDALAYKSQPQPAASCTAFTEPVWEEYALGMKSDEDCKPLEEHLLICSTCQDHLAEVDEFIRIAKAALARIARQLPPPMSAAMPLALALLLYRSL
jgi:hypothetical protein